MRNCTYTNYHLFHLRLNYWCKCDKIWVSFLSSLRVSISLMERTSVNSMNFDDEDEGIPESPHSSLSNASDGHFTPNFYHHHSVASSTFVRAYSDTDSAFDDSDCQQHSLPVDSHVLFFFLKSQQVSYERLCKWLESCVTDLRMKRQTEHPGFILKSLEKGGESFKQNVPSNHIYSFRFHCTDLTI